MKKYIATLILSACSTIVMADEWYGKDKQQHAIAGALIGSTTTLVTKSPVAGCISATVVGAVKEVYDSQHPDKHTASYKDFVVTAVAGCAMSGVTGLIITPRSVVYNWSF